MAEARKAGCASSERGPEEEEEEEAGGLSPGWSSQLRGGGGP